MKNDEIKPVRGLEIRGGSMRVTFLPGKPTFKLDGAPIVPNPRNIKWANQRVLEIREKIKHGVFNVHDYFPANGAGPGGMTVSAQLEDWLAAQRVTKSTRDGYESIIKFWNSQIGDKPLRTLRHSEILKALASFPNLSGKTINNRVSVLRKALQLAVRDKIISENLTVGIDSSRWQRPPPDPFTAEEVDQILQAMGRWPQVANYLAFKFFTGLRTGESFDLRWHHIDLRGKYMLVQSSFVSGQLQDHTKTNKTRKVLLNSRAMAALTAQKQHTFMAGEHVFMDPRNDSPWLDEPQVRWFWVPTLKRLGIRHRRPYNTRHTYATMMLMAGMTPAFCAGQMGHSVEMFLDVYSKWIPGAGDEVEMAKLEARIGAATSPELPQKSGTRR